MRVVIAEYFNALKPYILVISLTFKLFLRYFCLQMDVIILLTFVSILIRIANIAGVSRETLNNKKKSGGLQ